MDSSANSSQAALFSDAIKIVKEGSDLTEEQTSDLIDAMLVGAASEDQVGHLLLALKEKGEAVSELVGAARAMRKHMTKLPHQHELLLDTCGTGGSGSGTFNISTGVAIVAAACGVAVAKHGNRKASSLTGSADVLEVLGVTLESDPESVASRLDEIGICFCFAAKLHPAMRHVVGGRKKLGVTTLFNLLGPLCNPAGATHQLLGTSSLDAQNKVADALRKLGTRRSYVIHAEDGQDEISLDGVNRVIEVTSESSVIHEWGVREFGLLPAGKEALVARDPEESAGIIRRLLDGEPGPCRDTVLAGAASALLLVERVASLQEGVRVAAEAIDSGAAANKLAQLCEL